MLELFATVRVERLLRLVEAYDPWQVNKREPTVGDEGAAIVDVLRHGPSQRYVVECVATDGSTVWLSEFEPDELCPLSAGHAA